MSANIYTGGLIGADPVDTSGIWGVGPKGITYTDFFNAIMKHSPTLWLDASDTSTISESGGAVSQWSDKSGNGNHVAQANAANQPSTGTATIGGLNALSFDGSADYLAKATNTLLVNPSDGTFTVFAVIKNDTLSGVDQIVFQDAGTPRMPQFLRTSGTTPQSIIFTGVSAVTDNGATISTGTNYLLTALCETDNLEVFVNGTSSAGTAVTAGINTESLPIGVGARNTGLDYWDGLIGEIVVIPKALTAGEQDEIEELLTTKWGV